ncbi:MAG: tetratricopeptide repeat protein, partial [Deltaproteobacteria bacterium]|nr:tetratricopeptide repeat protein [Deltaproteobacteria bacterium]
PGLKISGGSDLPGLKTGGESDLPGLKISGGSDLPGLKQETGNNLPGLKSADNIDLPGVKTSLPGVKDNLPGKQDVLPGVKTSLPGVKDNLPDKQDVLPGVRTSLPGVKDENYPESFDFQSRELGGIKDSSGAEAEDVSSFSLEISDSSLLDKSGSSSNLLASLENSVEISSGKTNPFSEEITVPLNEVKDEDSRDGSLELVSVDVPEFIENKKSEQIEVIDEIPSGNSGKIIIALGGILAASVIFLITDWVFGFTGIFGESKNTQKSEISKKVSRKPGKIVHKKRKNKFYFEISGNVLIEKSKKSGIEGCEAALLNLLHNHDVTRISSCAPYMVQKINTVSDEKIARLNVLKLLILASDFPSEVKGKIFKGKITEPLKKSEKIITQFLSKNRKSSLWNFYKAMFYYVSRDTKKMKIALNQARTQEAGRYSALEYYAGLLGDKDAWKYALKIKGFERTARILPQLSILYDVINNPVFIPYAGDKWISVKPMKELIKDNSSPRVKSLEHLVQAWDNWIKGDLKKSFSHCSRAIKKDPGNEFSGAICSMIWVWHGYFGKITSNFSGKTSKLVEPYRIMAWLADGRKAAVMAVWEEFSSKNPASSKPLKLFVKMLTSEPWQNTVIDIIKEDNIEETCSVMLQSAMRIPSSAVILLKILEKNSSQKKCFKDLKLLLEVIKSYVFKDGKKLQKLLEKLNFSNKGAMLPYTAMAGLAGVDLKEKIPSMLYDSYGISYEISKISTMGDSKKAISILEKEEKNIKDQIFFISAANIFLESSSPDRLFRARQFADKAVTINPSSADNQFLIGRLHIESGQYETGEKLLEKAANAGILKVDDFIKWSNLEVRVKRFKSAVDALDYGLKKYPENTELLFAKANLFVEQNNPKKAVEVLMKIPDDSKQKGMKYILLGNSYLKLRRKKEAQKAFGVAIKASPESADLHFKYAKILLSENLVSKAIKHFETAISLVSKNKVKVSWLYEAHRLAGGAYKERGNRRKAIHHIRKYSDLVGDGPLKLEAMRLLRNLGAE